MFLAITFPSEWTQQQCAFFYVSRLRLYSAHLDSHRISKWDQVIGSPGQIEPFRLFSLTQHINNVARAILEECGHIKGKGESAKSSKGKVCGREKCGTIAFASLLLLTRLSECADVRRVLWALHRGWCRNPTKSSRAQGLQGLLFPAPVPAVSGQLRYFQTPLMVVRTGKENGGDVVFA